MIHRAKRFIGVTLAVLLGLVITGSLAKEVKVFILAGQSNMVGFGTPDDGRKEQGSEEMVKGGLGSLRHFVNANKPVYGPGGSAALVDNSGEWLVRDDVYLNGKPLQLGGRFGPEYGFGHMVGNAIDDPILIINTAWGGKDLAVDFRPPSSGDTPLKKDREVGAYYRKMLEIVRQQLDGIQDVPGLRGHKPRIAGFGWHQGWNDGCSQEMVNEYEANMVNFIKDIRSELGVKDLPFVIANSGMGNPTKGRRDDLCKIQLAVGDRGKHREFAGTVASVETRGFWRPGDMSPRDAGYHWNANGETYFLIGEAMGKEMLKLVGSASPAKPAAAPKPKPAVKPVRAARSLAPDKRTVLDQALKSTLGKLSGDGALKPLPLGISPTRARVWLKSVDGDQLSFQLVGGTQTAAFKWSDLKPADHATLSLLVATLKSDSEDAQAMAAVYLESQGRVTEAEKYFEKAGKASREKLEKLFD